jgi:hypothetical protein
LSHKNVSWLGQVPIPDLIRLRAEMANIEFRKRLGAILSELDSASPDEFDSSLARVAMAIEKLLVDHEHDVRKIDKEYRRRHAQTLTGFVVSLGAAFLPSLPIVGSVAAITAAGKFAVDSVDQWMRKRQASKTMMGVLAASARSSR